ncbi:MAG: hypothetical protein CL607_29060 [Anaerolineaceae bacterium]|nr:hypothetical protein [Anaerolineaceae bacterium]
MLLLLIVLLTGCAAQTEENDFNSFWLILDGTHTVQEFGGSIIVLGGAVVLPENSQVNGHLLLITGSANIDGTLDGSLYALGGVVAVGESGIISSNVNVGGGQFIRHPNAQIGGPINLGDAPDLPSVATMTGSSALDAVIGFALQTIPLLFFAVILARFLPHSLGRIEAMIVHHASVSGATGVLVLLVGLSLLVAMAFTVVLIPVAIISGFLLLLAVGIGWIALGIVLGRQLVRLLPRSPGLTLTAVMGIVILRLLLAILEPIPLIGTVAIGLTMAVGIGAVAMTRFGQRRYTPPDPNVL